MLPVGLLGAIEAPSRDQARELGDSDAKHLLGQDVIDTLLQVRNLGLQPVDEAPGDLRRNTPDLVKGSRKVNDFSAQMFAPSWPSAQLSQQFKHLVGQLRGGEHLVVRQVGNALQHVRVAVAQTKGGLLTHRGCSFCRDVPHR